MSAPASGMCTPTDYGFGALSRLGTTTLTTSAGTAGHVAGRARSTGKVKQCACCHCTSTPLWRDIGNDVPLCNACGEWSHSQNCSFSDHAVPSSLFLHRHLLLLLLSPKTHTRHALFMHIYSVPSKHRLCISCMSLFLGVRAPPSCSCTLSYACMPMEDSMDPWSGDTFAESSSITPVTHPWWLTGIRWKKYGLVCNVCQYVPCKQERDSKTCKRCNSVLPQASKRARLSAVAGFSPM